MTNGATQIDGELFGGAPFLRLFARCRMVRTDRPDIVRRAEIAIALSWIPLAVLTIAQGSFLTSRDEGSFLLDVAVHARCLLALPLLVVADFLLTQRLAPIVQHFVDVGIVQQEQRPQFDAAVASTRRLVNSFPAEAVTIALGYAIVFALMYSLPATDLPRWHRSDAVFGELSWAGWWHALVSLPLLIIAFLGLLWRWALWFRLLRRISRLDLALVPTHPDGVAGLRFASYSVRAFALHGFVIGVIAAGSLANRVLYEGASLFGYRYIFGGLLAFVAILFAGPLLIFTKALLDAWRRGIFEYGALADRLGRQFEREWFGRRELDRDALSRPDFSATTDLYAIVANVYSMRLVLFDLKSILLLVILTAAPFLPVMLIAMPFGTILSKAASMLL